MQDFREDLEFRFSFGITAIIRRINAYRLGKPITAVSSQPLFDIFVSFSKFLVLLIRFDRYRPPFDFSVGI